MIFDVNFVNGRFSYNEIIALNCLTDKQNQTADKFEFRWIFHRNKSTDYFELKHAAIIVQLFVHIPGVSEKRTTLTSS